MDPLTRLRSQRGAHRGVVTKAIGQLDALVREQPTDETIASHLRSFSIVEETFSVKVTVLLSLDEKIQMEIEDPKELEDDIRTADELQWQIKLRLLELRDVVSQRKSGPPPPSPPSVAPPSGTTEESPPHSAVDPPQVPVLSTNSASSSFVNSTAAVRLPKLAMPTFSGDPLEWQTFWDTFETSVHSSQALSGVQKFQYLHAQLNGPAARTIAGLTPTNGNYQHAIDLLRQRFGQSHKVTAAHMNALLRLNTPSANHRDLRMFYDNICCHIRGLEAAGRTTETYGDCLVPIVFDRLPPQVRQQVTREHGSTDWAISPLLEALRREIEVLELVPTSQDDATPLLSAASFASVAQRPQREAQPSRHWDSRSRKCVFCSAVHPPQACTSVSDPNRRWDIVRSKRLCFNCLGPHHASACPTTVRCRTCGKKHHTSLCDPVPPAHRDAASVSRSSTQALPSLQPPVQTPPTYTVTEPPNSPMTAGHTTCATSPACLATGEQVILQTAYSTVSGEDGSSMDTRLLLDSGSQRTYMSERLARQLHLQPVLQEPLAVSTFGNTRPFTMDTYVVHFYLLLKDGSRLAMSANVVPNITGAIHRGPTPPEDEAFLRALSPEQLADHLPVSSDAASIDLLLGSDYFWNIVSADGIALPSGLLLVSSKLGYILTGKCRSFSSQPAKEVGTLFAQTQVLQSIPAPSYTTSVCGPMSRAGTQPY